MMSLNFKDVNLDSVRVYEKEGKKYFSVTSVLSILADPAYIQKWKQNAGDTEVEAVMSRARRRGDYVHLEAQNYFKNNQLLSAETLAQIAEELKMDVPPIDEKIQRYLAGFNVFIATHGREITPLAVDDERLYDDVLGISGLPDLVCVWDYIVTLVDWKTSSTARLDRDTLRKYWIQLSTYAYLWNLKHPNRLIERLKIVPFTYARKNGFGVIETLPLAGINECFGEFREILEMFKKVYSIKINE